MPHRPDQLPAPAGIAFDLDGTLVDTVGARIDGWLDRPFFVRYVPDRAERQALYVEAVAEQLDGERRDAAVGRYSECSVADGLEPLSVDEVTESAPYRMYRAAVTAAFMTWQ